MVGLTMNYTRNGQIVFFLWGNEFEGGVCGVTVSRRNDLRIKQVKWTMWLGLCLRL